MRARVQLALLGCLVSIGFHLYLTTHYYALKFGYAAGNSVCNINAHFDCDAASASEFSSLFGIPLSVWGAVTNLVLLLMIFISWLEWSETPERFKRWTVALAGGSLAASVIMGVISLTQLHSYCLFCISLYALSTIIFFALKGLLREPFWLHIKGDVSVLWRENKGIVAALVAIPILSYMTHQMFIQGLGAAEIDNVVRESIQEWDTAPKFTFVAKPSLVMGPAPEAAAMTLVEFADFRCGHCKAASYSLHAFVKSHPDVRFEFYSFPLDGACNEKIEGVNGISCRLAAAVFCAEKEGKGWEMHETLYDVQEQVNGYSSIPELDPFLGKTVAKLGLNWDRLQTCMTDPSSQDAIRAQAKQGGLVDVRGTPTIFANGKLLNHGNIRPVLQAAREKAIAGK